MPYVDVYLAPSSKIFVLDDDMGRIKKFFADANRCGFHMMYAKNAKQALTLLSVNSHEKFNAIFLDHDLAGTYTVCPEGPWTKEETGCAVARYLAENGNDGSNVIIHSWNPVGASNMKAVLPKATKIPFGDFLIQIKKEEHVEGK